MWLFDLFRRKPAAAPVFVELPTRERCAFVFGDARCHMRRTAHGKFCTFHR